MENEPFVFDHVEMKLRVDDLSDIGAVRTIVGSCGPSFGLSRGEATDLAELATEVARRIHSAGRGGELRIERSGQTEWVVMTASQAPAALRSGHVRGGEDDEWSEQRRLMHDLLELGAQHMPDLARHTMISLRPDGAQQACFRFPIDARPVH